MLSMSLCDLLLSSGCRLPFQLWDGVRGRAVLVGRVAAEVAATSLRIRSRGRRRLRALSRQPSGGGGGGRCHSLRQVASNNVCERVVLRGAHSRGLKLIDSGSSCSL